LLCLQRNWKTNEESKVQEEEKKDLRGPRCFECSGFGHIKAKCGNLIQVKGKAYNATLNESEEEETLDPDQKFLAFIAPHVESEGSTPTTQKAAIKTRKNLKRPTKSLYEVVEVEGDVPTACAGTK
jgi:hypothetical protein